MDAREIKARQLVAGGRITRGNGYYWVPSQSGGSAHKVVVDGFFPCCTCADFELTGQPCKHMIAVRLWIEQEQQRKDNPPVGPQPKPEIPPTPKRKTYPQAWAQYNLAQTRCRDHFQGLLFDLTGGIADVAPKNPIGRGRPPVPRRDAVYAIVFKAFCGMSARRFMCDLNDAHERGYLSRAMCHNSVINAMDDAELFPVLSELVRVSALPLAAVESKFAVDSSGFCTTRYTRWFDQKHGTPKAEADWVKAHICVGVSTGVVTAVEIHGKHAADTTQLPPLVATTAKGFRIIEVSADKAYAGNPNFEAVDKVGGTLYAAFRSNTTGATGGLFEKAYHYFCLNREEFLKHYHPRSNVEATFSAVKRLFAEGVKSKTDPAQKNEVLCKLIGFNLTCLIHAIYELGIDPIFWMEPDEPRDILRFPGVGFMGRH